MVAVETSTQYNSCSLCLGAVRRTYNTCFVVVVAESRWRYKNYVVFDVGSAWLSGYLVGARRSASSFHAVQVAL